MGKFQLKDPVLRPQIDLQDYETEIETAVKQVLSNATVTVQSDEYEVTPAPSSGEARAIGIHVAQINGLSSHVKVVTYNQGVSRSGQLFRRKP